MPRRSACVLHRLWAAGLCLFAACGGDPTTLGLDQPLWVTGAAFKPGRLPGAAPVDRTASGDADRTRLTITSIETNNTVVHSGQSDKRISGRATDDGYAIALRFEQFGDGYWVKALDETDTAYPGELSFRVSLQLAPDLPLGKHRLLFTVIDGKGRAGRQQALEFCISSRFDPELNACDDTQRPPAATITLSWDSRADLDLQVRTPDGELVDASHPSALAEGASADEQGILYADRHAHCDAGGAQREDLVFANEVPPGRYQVYVNAFDACDEPASFFEVTAYARSEGDDGTYQFRRVRSEVQGELLQSQANGGRNEGVWVTNVDFP
jgi:hypothetical protein